MPTNIEIKARLRQPEQQRATAARLSASQVEVLTQRDTFFAVPVGRLKLRELSPVHGQLIHYVR